MDVLKDDNLVSGSSEDNLNDENTLCLKNNNSDEPDTKTSTTVSSSLITELEIDKTDRSKDDPQNNSTVEFIDTEQTEKEEGEPQIKAGALTGIQVLSTGNEYSTEPTVFPSDSLKKQCSDDDSVDTSSDSSLSSSSSSSDSEMDDDDDEEVVVLPQKATTTTSVKEPEEVGENGQSKIIPDFPTYRDNDSDSSYDSSSDSTSSTSEKEEEDNDTDHRDHHHPKQKSSPHKDSGSENRLSRPRVKGEIFPEDLPALENLNICVGDDVDIRLLGKITSVIKNIAIAQAEFSAPIDQDSVVFLQDRTSIGKVHDIFGPVRAPFYSILLDKEHTTIVLNTEVYCAPAEEQYTKYVFVNDLKNLKGSDASWENDVEPPAKFLDYSDDEQERAVKKKKCKNSANTNGDSNDDPDGHSCQRIRNGSSFSGISVPRKWKKAVYNRGDNSSSQSGAKKSMFACSMKWPPGNEQGSFTNYTPPPPPPYHSPTPPYHSPTPPPPYHSPPPPLPQPYHPPQPNHPTFHPEYNQYNQTMWSPDYPQPNFSADATTPFQPSWNFPQNQPNMDPFLGSYHQPQSGGPFMPPPPNQPWFPGPRRPPLHSQGPPRPPGAFNFMRPPPPRFSKPPQFPGVFP